MEKNPENLTPHFPQSCSLKNHPWIFGAFQPFPHDFPLIFLQPPSPRHLHPASAPRLPPAASASPKTAARTGAHRGRRGRAGERRPGKP